jgi:SAM-dependent methyltransferase
VIEPAAVAQATASYSVLASEYYDFDRHPTCAAFRAASAELVAELVPDVPAALSIEVGAGDSLLAREIERRGHQLTGLLLTDESPEMLRYSSRTAYRGARLVIAQAHELPVESNSIRLLVGSLADPYDDERFWGEIARVLDPQGVALVTVPSWEWAQRFRDGTGDAAQVAVFELASGERIEVPSLVRPATEEIALIEGAGLRVLDHRLVPRAAVEQRAPKLDILQAEEPVVVGYLVGATA